MVKIKIFICTIWIAAFCVTISGCKSYRQSRKQNQKLYNAIETNEVEAAKEAIDDGANMNSFRNIGLIMDSLYGKSDKNPVYADTAMHEDNKIAQYLIRKGADPNYKDKDGISLLMLAAQQGNIKFCKQLVEKGADVKYKKRNISSRLRIINGRNSRCQNSNRINRISVSTKNSSYKNDKKNIDQWISYGRLWRYIGKHGIYSSMGNEARNCKNKRPVKETKDFLSNLNRTRNKFINFKRNFHS